MSWYWIFLNAALLHNVCGIDKPMLGAKSKRASRRGASSKQEKKPVAIDWTIPVRALYGLLAVAVCTAVFQAYSWVVAQPVTRVVVNGDFVYGNRQSVVRQMEPMLGVGFVKLDLKAIKQQLKQEPWIYDVTIQRSWPDELVITVQEQRVIARWGTSALINHRGELFVPQQGVEINELIPMLDGPEGSSGQVMAHFRELNEVFKQNNISLIKLTLNDRGGWVAHLDSGIELVIGAGEVMEKVRRFVFAYQRELISPFAAVRSIDMRYSNGFAVAWDQVLLDGKS